MFLNLDNYETVTEHFPRVSGDVPETYRREYWQSIFSPRERGCSDSSTITFDVKLIFPA